MERYFKKAPNVTINPSSSLQQNQKPNQREPSSSLKRSYEVANVNTIYTSEHDPPSDPGLRPPLSQYKPNEQDQVRRLYLAKGPCQPKNHKFPQRGFSSGKRRFNKDWFDQYNSWLEYSIEKDVAFISFAIYLGHNIVAPVEVATL
jgi:hypothetical protein